MSWQGRGDRNAVDSGLSYREGSLHRRRDRASEAGGLCLSSRNHRVTIPFKVGSTLSFKRERGWLLLISLLADTLSRCVLG